MHQRFQHYITRYDFVSRVDNGISHCPSRSHDLTNASLLAYMDKNYPHSLPWWLWTPPSEIVSTIASMLRRTKFPRASLLVDLLPPMITGKSGPYSAGKGPLNPYSSNTGTWSPSSTTQKGNTGQGGFSPSGIN